MLTPDQFRDNYFALLAESEEITDIKVDSYMWNRNNHIFNSGLQITSEQWSNLVKVASIIKSNEDRFDMSDWHTENSCGTAHCIAGWATSLHMNDTNFDGNCDHVSIASAMLSQCAEPFFWITDYNLGVGNIDMKEIYKGLPEKLVMKWFIDPILEEALKESHELSTEINQFIQKAREETQELTTV